MFELIIGVTGIWLWIGLLFAINNQFTLKPVPVQRTLRTVRYRSLRRIKSQ